MCLLILSTNLFLRRQMMEELVYTLLDEEVTDFKCGNNSIDRMIKDSYFQTLLKHGYAYKFCSRDKTLGYYMVNFEKIKLSECEKAIDECYDEGMKNFYSVHIRFIAVDSKYQKHKIGETMLNIIVKDIRELSGKWPVRMITLDALRDKYDWYIKNGFLPFNENDYYDDKINTIKMYIDCQTSYNIDKLNEYISERGD